MTKEIDYWAWGTSELIARIEELELKVEGDEGYFCIVRTCRDDLKAQGYDTTKVTNENMETIARHLEDVYVENDYWGSLEYIADELKIPQADN